MADLHYKDISQSHISEVWCQISDTSKAMRIVHFLHTVHLWTLSIIGHLATVRGCGCGRVCVVWRDCHNVWPGVHSRRRPRGQRLSGMSCEQLSCEVARNGLPQHAVLARTPRAGAGDGRQVVGNGTKVGHCPAVGRRADSTPLRRVPPTIQNPTQLRVSRLAVARVSQHNA